MAVSKTSIPLPAVPTIVAAAAMLSGCLDIVHSVSRDGDDTVGFLKLAIQKLVFELAAAMSGESREFPNEFYEQEFGFAEEGLLEEYPEGADLRFQKINDELEYGFQFTLGPRTPGASTTRS